MLFDKENEDDDMAAAADDDDGKMDLDRNMDISANGLMSGSYDPHPFVPCCCLLSSTSN